MFFRMYYCWHSDDILAVFITLLVMFCLSKLNIVYDCICQKKILNDFWTVFIVIECSFR